MRMIFPSNREVDIHLAIKTKYIVHLPARSHGCFLRGTRRQPGPVVNGLVARSHSTPAEESPGVLYHPPIRRLFAGGPTGEIQTLEGEILISRPPTGQQPGAKPWTQVTYKHGDRFRERIGFPRRR